MVSCFLKTSNFVLSSRSIARKLIDSKHFSVSSKLLATSTTVNSEEVKKFDSKSNEWWHGKEYELLHASNSWRVPLIRDGILSVAKYYEEKAKPLEGYCILDVGCGGGILSVPLARLGAKVTGLDPGSQNIQAAIEHSSKDPEIEGNLNFVCDTVENLAASDDKYDAVVCSEVIEHVDNVQTFVESCIQLTKENGSLFFTTLNKTYLSYFLSICMAEYVLNLVPRGTHEWGKFVKPEDLTRMLELLGCRVVSLEGITYNPITKQFSWCNSTANWYALHAVKE